MYILYVLVHVLVACSCKFMYNQLKSVFVMMEDVGQAK